MNKVYFFREKSGDYGGVYVAEDSWKAARKIALKDDLFDDIDNPITDIKGHVCRKNKKPIITEFEGILSMQQICDLSLTWWDCEKCGDNNFEIINHELKFKCRNCGFIDNIPYVNY